jgi:RNase P subunit RPR2
MPTFTCPACQADITAAGNYALRMFTDGVPYTVLVPCLACGGETVFKINYAMVAVKATAVRRD